MMKFCITTSLLTRHFSSALLRSSQSSSMYIRAVSVPSSYPSPTRPLWNEVRSVVHHTRIGRDESTTAATIFPKPLVIGCDINNDWNGRRCSSEAVSRKRIVPNKKSMDFLASLGIDCDKLQKLRPTVLKQDAYSLKQHVDLLRGLGLDDPDIINIIYKDASFLRKDVKLVQELVDYLVTVGLRVEQLANIFQRAPRFYSTPETVIGNIEYMKYLEVTDKNICYTLVYTPSLFYRVQNGVERVASYLKQVMTEEKFVGDQNRVIRYVMRNDPTLFVRQVSELETNVKFLRKFGFSGEDLISVIRYCPSSIRIGTEFLQSRCEYLQKRLVLSNEKLKDLVRRHPQLLHASVETIQSHIDLVLELGFTVEDIIRTPRIFARSIDLIKKRHKELTAVGYEPKLNSFILSKEKHELILLKFKLKKRREDREKEKAVDQKPT
ncbi:transcription termination factor 1, mitochondrial-like [Diadema antillarum]|uniref:transcription termination factor 1, mitochondrial-like n=1 Tax=Diadema antillarum TaxID=105358 RepID=UPI003A867822